MSFLKAHSKWALNFAKFRSGFRYTIDIKQTIKIEMSKIPFDRISQKKLKVILKVIFP